METGNRFRRMRTHSKYMVALFDTEALYVLYLFVLLNVFPLSAVKMWICSCHRKKVEVLRTCPLMFPQSPKLSSRNAPSPLWEMKAWEPYSKRERRRTENPRAFGKERRTIENFMPWHHFPQIF